MSFCSQNEKKSYSSNFSWSKKQKANWIVWWHKSQSCVSKIQESDLTFSLLFKARSADDFSGVWCHVIRVGACQVLERIFVKKKKVANSLLLPCASARGKERVRLLCAFFSSVNIRLPEGDDLSIAGSVRAWCCRPECCLVQDYCSGDRP